jgi:hypothetical protein
MRPIIAVREREERNEFGDGQCEECQGARNS